MAPLLPLFPLQLVVFPWAKLPLHIFEARYREMVGEAEASGGEFGIVRTITRGDENGIAGAGCTVKVESVTHRYPDGRFDVMTRGIRRFRIVSLDDDLALLRGVVEYFDDNDQNAEAIADELRQRALDAHARLREVTGAADPAKSDHQEGVLSFRLAEDIDDLDFRSLMLQSRSEPERLRMFTKFAGDYIPRLRYVVHMKEKAPTNGSGHKRPDA